MMKTEDILRQVNQLQINNRPVAVGNDIVHLPTFLHSLTPQFIKRSYTPLELSYCEQFADSRLRYASTWAAKEAVYKAIKQADDSIRLWWRDIEIHRPKPQGKPTVTVKKLNIPLEFSLTISHDGDYVWALALCVYDKRDTL
jgi:holo-[acyl-carrier protein] synthase